MFCISFCRRSAEESLTEVSIRSRESNGTVYDWLQIGHGNPETKSTPGMHVPGVYVDFCDLAFRCHSGYDNYPNLLLC